MFSSRINDSIELRLYQQSQAETVFSVTQANRDHIRVWLPWVDAVKGIEDTHEFIRKSLEQFAADNGFQCGIWDRDNYIGGIGFHWLNRANGFTEIGYWLTKSAEGRGIISACCPRMIDHAFDEMRLHKVEIRAAASNHRSRAVPKRLGFVEEGVLRQVNKIGSTFHDLVVYGMLASEWAKLRENQRDGSISS